MDIKHLYLPSVFTNCYLLSDPHSGAAAVIDPGDGEQSTLSAIEGTLSGGLTLRAVFLTHGHYDHVGGVNALRQRHPDVNVYLHPADAGKSSALMPTAALRDLTLWRDGDVVKLGNLNVEVLHTPGHTPGSVCLRCRDVLFTGDTLFAGSMGRVDFPGSSSEDMAVSLKRLGQLEGDYQVLPGHDRPTTLERERQDNPFLRMAMADEWTPY